MAWPDNTPVIDTTNFLNDSGTVTGASGARNELVTLINRLNQALDSIDAGDTPYTDNNSADLMKKLATGTANDICLLNSNGYPIRSAKTISTTVGTTDATVPTGKAVQTYVSANAPNPFQAYGKLSENGGIFGALNIASVSGASGSWSVTFINPFTDINYVTVITPYDSNTINDGVACQIMAQSTTGFTARTYRNDDPYSLIGVDFLNVMVLGTLA